MLREQLDWAVPLLCYVDEAPSMAAFVSECMKPAWGAFQCEALGGYMASVLIHRLAVGRHAGPVACVRRFCTHEVALAHQNLLTLLQSMQSRDRGLPPKKQW